MWLSVSNDFLQLAEDDQSETDLNAFENKICTQKKKKGGHVKTPGHTESQRRRSCEDRGREMTDASVSQGTPRIANNQQKLGEA